MSEAVFDISNLTKTYPNSTSPSLNNVSFKAYPRDIIGILGPNGAGKTTLISILCNLLKPDSGKAVYYLNEKVLSPENALSHIGFVPQDFAFYEDLSTEQNLHFYGSIYNLTKQELTLRLQWILNRLELIHVKNKKVSTFSGGMKRRVNLAIGLIHNPRLLFLDEPTAGVDIHSRHAILALLKELNQQGTTIIYTSHLLKEAADFCTRIVFLNQGKIVANDTISIMLNKADGNLENLFINLTGNTIHDL